MWLRSSRITSWPGRVQTLTAIWLPIVPVGTNRAASFPVRAAAASSRRRTVGSSRNTSSPTSASAMARRMAAVGRVTVSDRRSISPAVDSCVGAILAILHEARGTREGHSEFTPSLLAIMQADDPSPFPGRGRARPLRLRSAQIPAERPLDHDRHAARGPPWLLLLRASQVAPHRSTGGAGGLVRAGVHDPAPDHPVHRFDPDRPLPEIARRARSVLDAVPRQPDPGRDPPGPGVRYRRLRVEPVSAARAGVRAGVQKVRQPAGPLGR